MTEAKLKQANDLDKTIKECEQAIEYLDAFGSYLRCRYTSPSTSTTSHNNSTFEGWYELPRNKEARQKLRDYYAAVLEETQKEFDSL
jgi:hypothetical protein